MYDNTYIRPFRQPYNPPEVSLIQKHAGFARFLKQHASPPHHRVTAGGRIVPAGPLSPPPMMLLPSINAVVTNPDNTNQTKTQGTWNQSERKGSGIPKTTAGTSAAPLAQQPVNVNSSRQNQALDTFANPQYTQMLPSLSGQNSSNIGPVPAGATPIGLLPDGSSIVFYNGLSYQSFWDGRGAVMKPLQFPTPAPSQANYNPMLYPHMAAGGPYYGLYGLDGLTHHQDTNGSLRMANGTSQAQGEPQQLPAAESEDPQALHDRLASELTTLDRYAALHLHEFSAAENAQYTSRRRQLVEQLDSLRGTTENHQLPKLSNAQLYGAQAVPSWLSASHVAQSSNVPQVDGGPGNFQTALPSTPSNMSSVPVQLPRLGLNQRFAPLQTSTSKYLSPAAPPFIPSGAMVAVPDLLGTDPNSASNGLPNRKGSAVAQVTTAGASLGQGIHIQTDSLTRLPGGTVTGPCEFSRGSGPIAPRSYSSGESHGPGALPMVTLSDIEYANVPGFNPEGKPKLYCTTVGEFQEVLRRVREQAQLYGCKGGQSKDPAYDAEQDIRWAMADGEPIPLPKCPADHLAHPRPWSWDDSAFNYRPEVAISPIGSKSHTDDEARHSPSKDIGNATRSRADSWTTNPSIENSTGERGAYLSNSHRQYQPYMEDGRNLAAKSRTHPGLNDFQTSSKRGTPPRSVPNPNLRFAKSPSSYVAYPNPADTGAPNDSRDRDSDALSFDSQGIPRSHIADSSKP